MVNVLNVEGGEEELGQSEEEEPFVLPQGNFLRR